MINNTMHRIRVVLVFI